MAELTSETSGAPRPRGALRATLEAVRSATEALCRPLAIEDHVVQGSDEVSPPKWHLAHTTWFFETFVLAPFAPDHRPFHPAFGYLFNSYYQGVGAMHPRPERGVLSRPTVDEVLRYRDAVGAQVAALLEACDQSQWPEIERRVTIGIHHEQQHQELLLMDVKYNFWRNPLAPAYAPAPPAAATVAAPLRWHRNPGGLREVGHGGGGFAYDNETPRHQVYLRPFELASRCVTNEEYVAFIEDGGYERAELWLSDGFAAVKERGWRAPLYWSRRDHGWHEFTLHGELPLAPAAPVVHLCYFEAEAYARWAGCRLPTEQEWEVAAGDGAEVGALAEDGVLHPQPAAPGPGLAQLLGDVWEWTASPYIAYPGFRPLEGALGEYNGKFMCNQHVLRGGSFATAAWHLRATYRNFFYPHQRWAFAGLRLARDV
jgi:ergothioneine biosynthesis protein EgtB